MATATQLCPVCNGTGWRIVERDGMSGAQPCTCAAAKRVNDLKEQSCIPPLYQHATFDSFHLPNDNPVAQRGLAGAKLDVRDYVREFPLGEKPGLILVGDPGTGKTHLAVAALRELMEKGFGGIFWDYQTLFNKIRSGYDQTAKASDREAYREALDAEILLLDDLGALRVTDWVEDTITSIITHRCNHRLPLIATTNLLDPEFGDSIHQIDSSVPNRVYTKTTLTERIGARARSRLFEMCRVVRMPSVEDYRIRKSGQAR